MLHEINKLNLSYLDHLRENPEDTFRQFDQLGQYLVKENCTFRGTAMPTLLKPNFISGKQTRILVNHVESMGRILEKFVRLYLENEESRSLMKFSERENELFRIEPGYDKSLVISRLDAFLNDYRLHFLEFNCDSPAGIAYSDVLEEGFRELFREYPFLSGWDIHSVQRQDLLLDSLLECYRQFRSPGRDLPGHPVIAIVDWKDVSTYSEFQLHEKHFRSRGYDTVITSPQEFTLRNGMAYAGDREVHLVYKRVITRELLEKWDEVEGFLQCIREGRVCCCNSFRSYIVGNKKVLALITDPRFQDIYSPQELNLIRETIPWTQILSPSEVSYRGEKAPLQEIVLRYRENLVLKPANLYGGKDVHIGRATDPDAWERILKEHLFQETWVVQEYVDIPGERFPEADPPLRLKVKYMNINPFALLGRYSGTITRVSDHPVINVSAGGGLVPTFTASQLKKG